MPPSLLVLLALVAPSDAPVGGPTSPGAGAGGARVVMPASGVVIDGLAAAAAGVTRWEVEGTLVVAARDAKAVDRLLGFGDGDARRVTIEIRREACPPPPPPGTTSPWPRLGYAAIRVAQPERRAIVSCKMPDLALELRFPAAIGGDEDALMAAADRFEDAVAALHTAYSAVRVDLAAALGQRDKLALEAGADAPDALAKLGAPIALRSGLMVARAGAQPWIVRDLGGHDVLALLAPRSAGLTFQLLPFGRRYDCEEALAAALKSQPPALAGAVAPSPPPGWKVARATGNEGVVYCAENDSGGLVAVGAARVPREAWAPVAAPVLGLIGEQIARGVATQ